MITPKKGLLLAVLAIVSTAMAQPQSPNFVMASSEFNAGGAAAGSAQFQVFSAFGQPLSADMQSSSSFVLYSGPLWPALSPPLEAPESLVILAASPDVLLFWDAVPGAAAYHIYRSDNPSFAPSPATLIGTVSTSSYTDPGVVTTGAQAFYLVTALSAHGQETLLGKRAVHVAKAARTR